MVYKLPIPRTM